LNRHKHRAGVLSVFICGFFREPGLPGRPSWALPAALKYLTIAPERGVGVPRELTCFLDIELCIRTEFCLSRQKSDCRIPGQRYGDSQSENSHLLLRGDASRAASPGRAGTRRTQAQNDSKRPACRRLQSSGGELSSQKQTDVSLLSCCRCLPRRARRSLARVL